MDQLFVQMVMEATSRWESRHGAREPATPASLLSTQTWRSSMIGSARTVEAAYESNFP